MGKYHDLAQEIVKNVGGKENINGLTHCVTRLRFRLKDESIANDDVLKNMDGVVTVMKSGGQYQVVIGNHVPLVYADVIDIAGISEDSTSVSEEKMGFFNRVIDVISGCFQPFLGAMAAAGMIKGLNALLVFLGTVIGGFDYTSTSGTYLMLNAIGDSVFYFMPIIVGYTSSKKFGVHPMVGMLIGSALVYPNIQASVLQTSFETVAGQGAQAPFSLFGAEAYTKVFGIPWVAGNYTSSVIPVIFIMMFAGYITKIAKKVIPEVVANFLVPFFVLLISLPVGFLVIGPIINLLTQMLSNGFSSLMDFSAILYGAILGTLWQLLVIFGLHWSVIPLAIVQIGLDQQSQILTPTFAASFAQTATVAAMYFKLNNQKLKSLSIPAIISGVFGVTEPAIYGLTLPKKKPFIFSLVGAGVGGLIIMMFDVTTYTMGGLGIFGFMNFISHDGDASGVGKAFISVIASIVISFVLTYFFWNDEEAIVEEEATTERKIEKETVGNPIKGNILPLEKASDKAFSDGVLGKGIVIEPESGVVKAPFDGTVLSLFPTKHALGIVSDKGLEILIHIGFDTVQLDGKGFEAFVNQGDSFKKGDTLLKFDIKLIQKAGFSIETPVVITNYNDYIDILEHTGEHVDFEKEILTALV